MDLVTHPLTREAWRAWLEAACLMAPAGAAKVEAARQFDAFPRSAKRGILEWIAQAKTGATRAKRVEETARLAAEGVRANQWRR